MKAIRIRLRAYDSTIIDNAVARIISVLKNLNANIYGPVPLPTRRRIYTILRSVHKHKDSREQFEERMHRRLIGITNPSNEVLMKLKSINLPSSIDIRLDVQ